MMTDPIRHGHPMNALHTKAEAIGDKGLEERYAICALCGEECLATQTATFIDTLGRIITAPGHTLCTLEAISNGSKKAVN